LATSLQGGALRAEGFELGDIPRQSTILRGQFGGLLALVSGELID